MGKRVYLLTRDLVFRSKLDATLGPAGGVVSRDATACDLGVVDCATPGWERVVRDLRARGVAVLAFGPHVEVESLRHARALGAEAVPNSELELRLGELLQG
jgi:hypothetical protein